MFTHIYNLTSLKISKFDTSSINDMTGMFGYLYSLESLDITNFNT